jgi:hypothetical protein
MEIKAFAPIPGQFQFVQFVWHYGDVYLTNPNANWDPTPCKGTNSSGRKPDPNDPKDLACYFVPRYAGKWYVDARGLGLPGKQKQDPDYLKGVGAASCVTTSSAAMLDAPSSDAKFITIVLFNGQVVGVLRWFSEALPPPFHGQEWIAGVFDQGLDPIEKRELCNAENIMDYKPDPLAAICK